MTKNLTGDVDLRINLLEFYSQVFKAMKENEVFSGKKLRPAIQAILESAFMNLHEMSSLNHKGTQ